MSAPLPPGAAEAVEAALGHRFARPALLAEALTHRSAVQASGRRRGAGSNERLEFVGDRVLGLLMAEWLIERFPQDQEGELGRRFGHLVSRPVLAQIAAAMGLGEALAIAPNEQRAGLAGQANALADAMEAVIGAMFLDAGLAPARDFVRAAWAEQMQRNARPPKDPKTRLQEWLMARGQPLPEYRVAEAVGPSHRPLFTVEAHGGGAVGTGSGATKREAERLAAQDLMERLT